MELLNQLSLVHAATFILGLFAMLAAAISRLRYEADKKILGISQQAAFVIGVGLVLISVGFAIDDLVNNVFESMLVIAGFGLLGWGAYLDQRS